jgi:hypothetical protein
MNEIPLHWLPIVAAAVLRVIIGFLWYAPFTFGPQFMHLTGCSEAEMKARLPKAMLSDGIGALIMSFILVHAVYYAGARTPATGAAVGIFNWIGFILVTHFSLVAYEKRPFRLFLLNNGYQFISLAAMGALLAAWR